MAEPRLYTKPLRPLTRLTTRGYEVIDFAEMIGEPLLPWQQQAVIRALELRPDGRYRFRTVLIIVARQNGKSSLKRTVTLWRMYLDGAREVAGAAQDVRQARKQWQLCQDTIHACPELEGEWGGLHKAPGDEKFWASGACYSIMAANERAGRGGSNDEVNIDELRTQKNWKAWSSLSKTINARPNGQVWAMSNAGDDDSVVLNQLRESALAARDDSICILEWSAPDGCELDDTEAWRQANPALGYLMDADSIRSQMATDTPAVFRCLDIATPVLTARGTLSIGELRAGDAVKGTAGKWVDVVGTSETHAGRDCYRVTLNDGRSVVCDAGHLWTVRDRRRPRAGFETLRTTDLLSRGVTYHNPSMNFDVRNFSLPPVAPLDGPDIDLPVHPYLLGLWLGDGSRRSATIFTESQDADHIAARMEASGATITTRAFDSGHCERIGFRVGQPGAFTEALRSLGIYPQAAFREAAAADFRKFVPDVYLTASLAQRLALLQGLMDSDGTVRARGGRCCFVNTNAELISGVRSLVRSLGWKTSELEAGQYGKSHHLPRLSVDFTPRPGEPCPVTLPRKAERIRPARGYRDVRPVTVASIEPVPSVPVRCIQVDAADSLFLAGDLVPTHNTEVLCQRVRQLEPGAIDMDAWEACADPDGTMDALRDRICAVADVAADGKHVTLAVAALLGDGRPRIEVGGSWATPAEAAEAIPGLLGQIRPAWFGWIPSGPAAEMAPLFRSLARKYNGRLGAPSRDEPPGPPADGEIKGLAVGEACQGLAGLAKGRGIVHSDDPMLNAQAAGSRKLWSGDSWRFTRRAKTDDGAVDHGHVDGLYAAGAAVQAALTLPAPRRARIRMLA